MLKFHAHKFYSNECFPLPVVEFLRACGHNILTTLDAGKANKGIPDEHVLSYAIKQKRAVLTLNREDFIELHEEHAHFGIIVCMTDSERNWQRLADQIHQEVKDTHTLEGKLIRIVTK